MRDSALLLDLTSAPFPGDPVIAPQPARPYADEVAIEPGRLRIALVDHPVAPGVAVDAEVLAALADAARLCEDLGHIVIPSDWPELPVMPAAAMGVVTSVNIAAAIDDRLEQLGRAEQDDDLDGLMRMIVNQGRAMSARDYVHAVSNLHAIGRAVAAWMSDFDVVLTPTLAIVPPKIGVLDPMRPIAELSPVLGQMAGFLSIFNLTGQPAMSVPLATSSEGLPIGIHFAGHFGDESALLRLAGQLERARPWTGLAI